MARLTIKKAKEDLKKYEQVTKDVVRQLVIFAVQVQEHDEAKAEELMKIREIVLERGKELPKYQKSRIKKSEIAQFHIETWGFFRSIYFKLEKMGLKLETYGLWKAPKHHK